VSVPTPSLSVHFPKETHDGEYRCACDAKLNPAPKHRVPILILDGDVRPLILSHNARKNNLPESSGQDLSL
jgi:hypothetical protein